MKFKDKFKLLMKSVFTQFGSAVSVEGQQIIWNTEGDIAEGVEVYYEKENEQGELDYIPVPDGEYTLEDKVVIVSNGVVETIKEIEKKNPEEDIQKENLDENEPIVEVEEPVEVVEPENQEPEFDAKKAYEELKADIDNLRGEVDVLKEQLAKLLEVPAEQDAFSANKKVQELEQKKFLCKVSNR